MEEYVLDVVTVWKQVRLGFVKGPDLMGTRH